MRLHFKFVSISIAMSLLCMPAFVACSKDEPADSEIVPVTNPDYNPDYNPGYDPDYNPDDDPSLGENLVPTQYVETYQADGVTYKMIRVEAPSDAPFRSFYMMETELPINSYVRFGDHWIEQLDNGDKIVIKSEMQKFMSALRSKTNLPFRLPTKSEWQFAAAGGMASKHYKYAGGDDLDYIGWYKYNSGDKINEFGLKKPNELGFYDMSGNYAELCQNGNDFCNVDGPYCGGSYRDAAGDCTILSWKNGSITGNVAGTNYKEQNAVDSRYIGFRLVYTIVDELEPNNNPTPQPFSNTYYVGNSQHKLIFVEAPKNSKFKSFYMMETELPIDAVTSFDKYNWIAKMDNNGDGIITKAEFNNYLASVRSFTNLPFRLPTIDEWYFAASGGVKTQNYKYAGGDVLDKVGWYKDNSGGSPQTSAKKMPNELGLYDMSGNYAELCNETDDIYYVDGPYCGGSYKDSAADCTVTSMKSGIRTGNVPGTSLKEQNAVDTRYIGFRLIYSIDE